MRWLFRSKIAWVTLAFIALIGVIWWRNMPLATLTLDDGTKIRLERVTSGKWHEFELRDDRSVNVWQRIWNNISARSARFETEAEAPVYHFTVSGGRRRSTNVPVIARIHTFFSDGRIVQHRGLASSVDEDVPDPMPVMKVTPGSWYDRNFQVLCRGSLMTDGEKFFLADPYFDRRARTLKIRMKAKGKWYDWELPNVIPAQSWPEWNPDPLPIEKKHHELTLVVQGWGAGEGGLPALKTELRSEGNPRTFDYSLKAKFEDATGNVSSAPVLSMKERAWKAKVEVVAGISDAINEHHRFYFRGLKVPKAGECVILEVPESLKSQRVRFLALANAGKFAFEDGKSIAPQIGDAAIQIRGTASGWRADVSTDRCVLIVVDAIRLGTDDEHIDRGARFFGFVEGKRMLGRFTQTGASGNERASEIYMIQTISWDQDPQAGTSLDIMAWWPEIFRQEFFITPPSNGEK